MDGFNFGARKVPGCVDTLLASETLGSEQDISVATDSAEETSRVAGDESGRRLPRITCVRCGRDWEAIMIMTGCPCQEERNDE